MVEPIVKLGTIFPIQDCRNIMYGLFRFLGQGCQRFYHTRVLDRVAQVLGPVKRELNRHWKDWCAFRIYVRLYWLPGLVLWVEEYNRAVSAVNGKILVKDNTLK